MEFPICKVCLKNEMLCSACTELVKRERIAGAEVKNYRELHSLLKKEDHLQDITIRRVLGNNDFILVITTKNDIPKIIGKNGIIVKKLSKSMGRQIRVIPDTSDVEEMVKEVLFSTTILGINVLYTHDSKKYKIRIPSIDRISLPIEPDTFAHIANTIFHDDVELVFE